MKKINGPDLILALMAAIKSRNHISWFRGSCCQVNWTFQSPDPRFSNEASYRASPGGARSLPRIHTNGRSRSCRDFTTAAVPMHTTSRILISRWLISQCLSRLLSYSSRRLILRATSADLTTVDDPAPNLTALAAFDHSLDHSLLSTVAINDKHLLSVHWICQQSPLFTEFANTTLHPHILEI